MLPDHLWAWITPPAVAFLLWMAGVRIGKNGKVTDTMQERLLGEGERLEEKLDRAVAKLDEFQQTIAELRAETTMLRTKARLLYEQLEREGFTPVVAIHDPQ